MTRVLLDTHVWLWWLLEPERIHPRARTWIENRAVDVTFSAARAWEIAIKYALGKLPLPETPAEFVLPRLKRDGFSLLPIEHRHALYVADLPLHHRDPFDRLLVAQAMLDGVPIITADSQFDAYPAQVIHAS